MNMKSISLELIRTDGGTQMRAELHKDTYLEYRDVWKSSPESFPPLVLFYDGSVYWLADGFHRFYGAREAGLKAVPADVRDGTQRDAILYAVGANQSNGLRRTNLDKRRAVETLLSDAEWVTWSDVLISEQAGVGHAFVSSLRNELSTVESSPASKQADKPRKGKDGKLRKPPKPKPKPPREHVESSETKESPTVTPPFVEDGPEREPEKPVTVDGWGIPVAPHAVEAFADVRKFDELLKVLFEARKLFSKLADSPGGKFLQRPNVSLNRKTGWAHQGIENAIKAVKDNKPTYTCCPNQWSEVPGYTHDSTCQTCYGLCWIPDVDVTAFHERTIAKAKKDGGVKS